MYVYMYILSITNMNRTAWVDWLACVHVRVRVILSRHTKRYHSLLISCFVFILFSAFNSLRVCSIVFGLRKLLKLFDCVVFVRLLVFSSIYYVSILFFSGRI